MCDDNHVMRSALVVGGTGPTGPYVLQGLLDRGFDVTIFHRGTHEPTDLPDVRHIHGDPHFLESIAEAVGDSEYDVVVGAYGRTALVAQAFAGRTGHFIAIGAAMRYAGFNEPARTTPLGPVVPVAEDAPKVTSLDPGESRAIMFAHKAVATEEAVFAAHENGTVLIYPIVYGPRNLVPWEWSVIKRVQDGRNRMAIPDEGLSILTRGAAQNMADFVLRTVDRPDVAAGQVYNCADDKQYSVRQFIELLLAEMGADIEIISVPSAVSPYFKSVYIPTAATMCPHIIFDTSKARTELGYRDVVSTPEALAESVAWYRENPLDGSKPIPAFFDTFDYELEDAVIDNWLTGLADLRTRVQEPTIEDVHPMPHPKKQGVLADQRGR